MDTLFLSCNTLKRKHQRVQNKRQDLMNWFRYCAQSTKTFVQKKSGIVLKEKILWFWSRQSIAKAGTIQLIISNYRVKAPPKCHFYEEWIELATTISLILRYYKPFLKAFYAMIKYKSGKKRWIILTFSSRCHYIASIATLPIPCAHHALPSPMPVLYLPFWMVLK